MAKNEGAVNRALVDMNALLSPLLVVRIRTGPGGISAGTKKLICMLLTKLTGAASPFTVTPTPPTVVGSVSPVTDQLAGSVAKAAPFRATQALGAISEASKLPAFWMPVTGKDGTG